MKWTRAVHHAEALAQKCAELDNASRSIYPLRVLQLWVTGELLSPEHEVEHVTVALAVDLPPDQVPWLSEPPGGQHWANAARIPKNPIFPLWRSAHAPVWNHHIERPALLWDAETGLAAETLAAIQQGQGERVRLPAPTEDEFRARLTEELAIGLSALRQHTLAYEERRWSPGKLEPLADALLRASTGYLDLLDEVRALERKGR